GRHRPVVPEPGVPVDQRGSRDAVEVWAGEHQVLHVLHLPRTWVVHGLVPVLRHVVAVHRPVGRYVHRHHTTVAVGVPAGAAEDRPVRVPAGGRTVPERGGEVVRARGPDGQGGGEGQGTGGTQGARRL